MSQLLDFLLAIVEGSSRAAHHRKRGREEGNQAHTHLVEGAATAATLEEAHTADAIAAASLLLTGRGGEFLGCDR